MKFLDVNPKNLKDKDFRAKINISVIGVGQIGFRVCLMFADAGYNIFALDSDEEKIRKINSGRSSITTDELSENFNNSNMTASSDIIGKVKESQLVIVCVPTPTKDKKPDLSFVETTSEKIAKGLSNGMIIVYESTVYPGVTENKIIPILENSGLKAGKDFGVVYCPERVDPGNKKFKIKDIARVMAATDKKTLELAKTLYETGLKSKIFTVSNIKIAEMSKLVENTFRDINIAFVNELATILDGTEIDITEVIKAASTKPFAFMPHYPGCGVGGDCIPISPYWLIEFAKEVKRAPELVKLARNINEKMPAFVVEKLSNELNKIGKNIKDSKILILGLTYKEGVCDTRNSPSKEVINILKNKSKEVYAYDPYISEARTKSEFDIQMKNLNDVDSTDAIILLTPHKEFKKIDFKKLKIPKDCIFFDTKNVFDKKDIPLKYVGLGR
jgi:nucleotide sugar dehydrogenase